LLRFLFEQRSPFIFVIFWQQSLYSLGSQKFTRDVFVKVELKTLPWFLFHDLFVDFGHCLVLNGVRNGLTVSFFIACGSQHGLNLTVVTANPPSWFFRVAFTTKPLDQVHDDNKAEDYKQHYSEKINKLHHRV
jgi:hypothetical protein